MYSCSSYHNQHLPPCGFGHSGPSRGGRSDNLSCNGFSSQRTPLSIRQGHFDGRNGEQYGWGREGRVRLHTPSLPGERLSSMNGLRGVQGGVQSDGASGLSGRSHHHLFGRRASSLSHEPRFLDDHLLDSHRSPCAHGQPDLSWDPGARDRFGRGGPFMSNALGTPDIARGYNLGSLSSGSDYSLTHLDRFARPYHYQPPYVEDHESDVEEELWREQDGLNARHGINPRDFYDGSGPRDDFLDAGSRRGF
jgi:hypothetical protein